MSVIHLQPRRSLPAVAESDRYLLSRWRDHLLSSLFAKCVLDCHLVANELQEVTASGSHFLTAKVRRDKIPFKGSNVAGHNHFQIFEFTAWRAFEESLNTRTNLLFAKITLAKRIGSH